MNDGLLDFPAKPRVWTAIDEQRPRDGQVVRFRGISADFTHLQVILTGRGNAAVDQGAVLIRLNGDTGANYDRAVDFYLSSLGASGARSDGQTSLTVDSFPGTSAAASRAGAGGLLLPDYRGTMFYKTVLGSAGYDNSSGIAVSELLFGTWRSTSPITHIDVHFNAIETGWLLGTVATLLAI